MRVLNELAIFLALSIIGSATAFAKVPALSAQIDSNDFVKCGQVVSSNLLTRRIHQTIMALEYAIVMIADKTIDIHTRNYYKNRVLCLLVAKGEPYAFKGSIRQAVCFSLNEYGKQCRRICAKDYFSGIVNLRYRPITITGIKLMASEDIIVRKDSRIILTDSLDINLLNKTSENICSVPIILQHVDKGLTQQVNIFVI